MRAGVHGCGATGASELHTSALALRALLPRAATYPKRSLCLYSPWLRVQSRNLGRLDRARFVQKTTELVFVGRDVVHSSVCSVAHVQGLHHHQQQQTVARGDRAFDLKLPIYSPENSRRDKLVRCW
jgi:hypothetical protein